MTTFASVTDVRARFAETDAQGIVHHAVYLVWFELARVEFLERLAGGYTKLREQGVEALVTEAHVRFRVPARFDDRIRVGTRCVDIRGARFRFEYEVRRGDELLVDGWTGHGCVDAKTLRPTRVPEWLRDALSATAAAPA